MRSPWFVGLALIAAFLVVAVILVLLNAPALVVAAAILVLGVLGRQWMRSRLD